MSRKGASHKEIKNFDDLILALWLVLVLSLLNELSLNFSFYQLTLNNLGLLRMFRWCKVAEVAGNGGKRKERVTDMTPSPSWLFQCKKLQL